MKKTLLIFILLPLISLASGLLNAQDRSGYLLNSETLAKSGGSTVKGSHIVDRVDFGFVRITSYKTIKHGIRNTDSINFKTYIIDTVKLLQSGNSIFTINPSKPLPTQLKYGDVFSIDITCHPLSPNVFFDTVAVYFSEPEDLVLLIPLTATSYANTIITLPDTTAEVGVNFYYYPIKAKFIEQEIEDEINLECDFKISYNVSIFQPIGLTDGVITSNIINGNNRELTIHVSNASVSNKETVLTKIIGGVTIGSVLFSPIEIYDFSWNNQWIKTDTKSGKILLTGPCQLSLSLITLAYAVKSDMRIKPNPVLDGFADVEIETNEIGNFTMQLISMQGISVYRKDWMRLGRDTKRGELINVDIDLNYIASGLYYLVLYSPTHIYKSPITILK